MQAKPCARHRIPKPPGAASLLPKPTLGLCAHKWHEPMCLLALHAHAQHIRTRAHTCGGRWQDLDVPLAHHVSVLGRRGRSLLGAWERHPCEPCCFNGCHIGHGHPAVRSMRAAPCMLCMLRVQRRCGACWVLMCQPWLCKPRLPIACRRCAHTRAASPPPFQLPPSLQPLMEARSTEQAYRQARSGHVCVCACVFVLFEETATPQFRAGTHAAGPLAAPAPSPAHVPKSSHTARPVPKSHATPNFLCSRKPLRQHTAGRHRKQQGAWEPSRPVVYRHAVHLT